MAAVKASATVAAVKASATVVHEVTPEPAQLRPVLAAGTASEPSRDALKTFIESHAGWKAAFREPSAEERKLGRVFSVDVSFSEASACSAAVSARAEVAVIGGAEGGEGSVVKCEVIGSENTGFPQPQLAPYASPVPFVPRQKKRHNLAPQIASATPVPASPVRVTASVIQSFSPGGGAGGGVGVFQAEDNFRALDAGARDISRSGNGTVAAGDSNHVLTAVGTLVPPSPEKLGVGGGGHAAPKARGKTQSHALQQRDALSSSLNKALSRQKLRVTGEMPEHGLFNGINGSPAQDGQRDDTVEDDEGGGEMKVGNPIMSKVKFERALEYALQGDELHKYLDAHPELHQVPADFQLYVIARNHKSRCHYSYWLQDRADVENVRHFKSLQTLVLLLEDPEELYNTMACKDFFNPLAKGKFDSAIEFALQGEEEQKYIEQHPVLTRVPPTHRVYIIQKGVPPAPGSAPGKSSGKRVTFWLQLRSDPRVVKFYKGLLDLGAALEGEYSPMRARFEQALQNALHGEDEQEYLDQHPVLAKVPAELRLFIICRQSPGHTKSYNFWMQHRTDRNALSYFRSLHELIDVLEGRDQGGGAGCSSSDGEDTRMEDAASSGGGRGYNHHARAHFDRAKVFALQGEEEMKYLEEHPQLKEVPDGCRLYIVGKPRAPGQGNKYTFWLQSLADEKIVKSFQNLHEISDFLVEGGDICGKRSIEELDLWAEEEQEGAVSRTEDGMGEGGGSKNGGKKAKRPRNFSLGGDGGASAGGVKKTYNHHARAHFDRARAWALEGEELEKYLETHPVLLRVPEQYKLYIIAKPFGDGNAKRYSYYLQDRNDERDVTPFKNLQDLATALDEGYSPLKARFEACLPFALSGEEEQEYLDQHPVLAKVPSDMRLYIIGRQSPGRTRTYTFWLQHREQTDSVRFFRSLHELIEILDDNVPSDDSPDERDEVGGGAAEYADSSVVIKKKCGGGYNHHARAHFDRAKGFALQGEEERKYIEEHPMLQKVPSDYKLWIIAKMNKGEGRPRFTFWLQKRDDRKVLQWYKGLQELYTALWDIANPDVGSESMDNQGPTIGIAGGDAIDPGEVVIVGGTGVKIEGEAEARPGTPGGGAAPNAGGAGGFELTLPTNWGRCVQLLKESDEYVLKGEDKDEYLRLHPEIPAIPAGYELHIVSKPTAAYTTTNQQRRQYTFWIQQKKDVRVLKHYNSISELTAVLGRSKKRLTCRYCNKPFTNLQSHANHERQHLLEEGLKQGAQSSQSASNGEKASIFGVEDGEDKPRFTVGDRVKVYWDGEQRWFCGIIEKTNPRARQVKVRYEDDDEVHWEDYSAVLLAPGLNSANEALKSALRAKSSPPIKIEAAMPRKRGRPPGSKNGGRGKRTAVPTVKMDKKGIDAQGEEQEEEDENEGSAAAEEEDDEEEVETTARAQEAFTGFGMGGGAENRDWKQGAREVLKRAMNHSSGWPFLEPVDPESLELPDYFDVIEDPMDLGTIQNRLNKETKQGGYSSQQRFADDMRLVFQNAITYNDPGDPVFEAAKTMSVFFEDLWAKELAKSDCGPSLR